MNKNLLSILICCVILVLASCSTSHQAAKCPTFKQDANKAAVAQAKAKKNLNKKMQKHKEYLSEKYAMNRLERERAAQAEAPVKMAEVVKRSQNVAPIQSIDASAVASANSELIVPQRAFDPLADFEPAKNEMAEKTEKPASLFDVIPEEIVSKFTPKQKEKIEKKLTKIQEKVAKKQKKAIEKGKQPPAGAGKSQLIALVLCGLVGYIGIHRFYLGYIGIGVAQVLTAGGCGIWTLIDFIRILTGDLGPKDGRYDETL